MKYMGSKARMAKDLKFIIESIMREQGIDTYIEPFVGGCNVIEVINAEHKIANDTNKYLIALWKAMISGWNPPEEIELSLYKDIRENKDKYPEELVGAAGVFASFNGSWFSGHYKGGEKTKIGTVRNYYREGVENVRKQIGKLKDVEFKSGDYTQFSEVRGALIYCDPPYECTQGYENEFDSKAFWIWVRKMSEHNIVLVSEYYAPDDFKIIHEEELQVHFKDINRSARERVFTINDTKFIGMLEQRWSKIDIEELDDMI